MVSKTEYEIERKKAAKTLEQLNRQACIYFAELLRGQDRAEQIQRDLGIRREEFIPQRYFEITYRLLCFGKLQDRATLMLGTAAGIERLLSEISEKGGFNDENGRFQEIPE